MGEEQKNKSLLELDSYHSLIESVCYAKSAIGLYDSAVLLRNINRVDKSEEAVTMKPAFDLMYKILMKNVNSEMQKCTAAFNKHKATEAMLKSRRFV